ncbi:adenylate cyclase [Cribrihabitans marinus]|uniref:Adenylate cyclase n=1 Tax=Cribrihabitans marinus TaxID=1227549 RepID=A0A1H6XEZ4_9RHOB|nr:adenylate/guanylate cyclase domain-containing protein [Cribrihabitans marinus]GGH27281.1 hypothetical protein GCM10010973_15500 [Cribrihabitans marinus]SEJ27688.1 adenylate cyclase [Cribrihabitans marinus]
MTDQTEPVGEVDALMRQAALDAERLLSGLRMFVALGLGLFFLVAVKPADALQEPVLLRQWAFAGSTMMGYFLLGLLTWILSARGLFRMWGVWVVATADTLFVLSGLWLSLMNTGLEPGAIFVFPSAWLVPLVLAFAVIRGDPWVMAFTVAVLCLGLALLAIGGAESGQQGRRETLDLFLSLPPNVMRLAMIALAGIVLVTAARRVRRLLLRSIRDARSRANLTRYLPAQLADDLGEVGLAALQRGSRQEVGLLFVDIRGFTGMTQEMPPEKVSEFVSDYRRRVSAAAEKTRGIIDKFMGDAVLIVFEGDGAARRCLDCGLMLRADIADWSKARTMRGDAPVRVGIGMHWGEVFRGVVGDANRLEYSVFGDAVNIAARLESLTREMEMDVIASRDLIATAKAEAGSLGFIDLEPIEVRGRTGALALSGVAKDAPLRSAGTAAPVSGSSS